MAKTMAREIVRTCLDSCKSYDLPSEDYLRVVRSVVNTLEKYRSDIHVEIADFLAAEAQAMKSGVKGKEAQLMQVVLEGMATAVRNRT